MLLSHPLLFLIITAEALKNNSAVGCLMTYVDLGCTMCYSDEVRSFYVMTALTTQHRRRAVAESTALCAPAEKRTTFEMKLFKERISYNYI
jgi:hypothetical protein